MDILELHNFKMKWFCRSWQKSQFYTGWNVSLFVYFSHFCAMPLSQKKIIKSSSPSSPSSRFAQLLNALLPFLPKYKMLANSKHQSKDGSWENSTQTFITSCKFVYDAAIWNCCGRKGYWTLQRSKQPNTSLAFLNHLLYSGMLSSYATHVRGHDTYIFAS